MKTMKIYQSGTLALLVISIAFSGCSAKKEVWGSLKKGMNMNYTVQPDRELSYTTNFEFEQQLTVMNQEFTVTGKSMQVFEMKPLAGKSNDLDYLVTLADMNFEMETPRGKLTPELEEVIGKSFNLTLTSLGEELEYAGAEELIYDMGSGEKKSISSDIQAFFPNLPGYPVKVGDSWESIDKVTEKTGSGEMVIVFNNINTFEGLEQYGGFDCMKINVVSTAVLSGEGEQDGYELITEGEISGTSTWYYAYKEGTYVGNVSEGSGKTETEVLGTPEEMVIPAKRTFKMTTMINP